MRSAPVVLGSLLDDGNIVSATRLAPGVSRRVVQGRQIIMTGQGEVMSPDPILLLMLLCVL